MNMLPDHYNLRNFRTKGHVMTSRHIFVAVTLIGLSWGTAADADTILEHAGDTDPTLEGWADTSSGTGTTSIGPVSDNGTAAWSINDSTTTGNRIYSAEVLAEDVARGHSVGWTIDATVRIAAHMDGVLPSGATRHVSSLFGYRDGAKGWQVHFGLDDDNNTEVYLWTGTEGSPVAILPGNLTFNTYRLRYDSTSMSADLFINGVEVLSDYMGFSSTDTVVRWGVGDTAAQGQSNWSNVAFSTVPEPSSLAMLTFGVSLLGLRVVRRRLKLKRSQRPLGLQSDES